MKYTRNALGLLNAQYRSVLKKCLLINLGLFALGAGVPTANATVTLSPTLDSLKAEAQKAGTVSSEAYTLTKLNDGDTVPEGKAAVRIGKNVYYFSPNTGEDAKLLSILAGTPVASVDNVANPSTIKFDVTNIATKFPSSVFEYKTGTENDYNFVVQEAGQDGNITKKYYKIVLKTDNMHTSPNISWEKVNKDRKNETGVVAVKLPNKQTEYYKYTVDESKYNPILGTRLDNWTGDVGNATQKVLFKNLELYPSDGDGGAIYNTSNNGYNIYADFIDNRAGNVGAIFNEGTIHNITGDFIDNRGHEKGGAISNYGGTIGDITGDFIGNYAYAEKAYGGAIYNSGTIGDITGDFIGNYADVGREEANGGAIYNSGTIGNITGDFIDNGVYSYSSSVQGGAIDNSGTIGNITGDFIGNRYNSYNGADFIISGGAIYNSGTIGNITGDFIDNYTSSDMLDVKGVAIYNEGTLGDITGDFIGNYTSSGMLDVKGVAIYNEGTLGDITGDFIGNYASSKYAQGGAIYNIGTIGNITGDFIGNYASSEKEEAKGGAIYADGASNGSTIGDITGDFNDNYAISENKEAYGGAIYNSGISIGDISGNFNGNYVSSSSSFVRGGAIYNYNNSTIGDIRGNFVGNYASSSSSSDEATKGGAIFNVATIGNITGDFNDNYVSSSAAANGGAIYNSASIDNISGDFSGNYVSSYSSYVSAGGAIYNDENGTIGNITGDFSGNYIYGSHSSLGGAIFNEGTIGNITGDFSGNYASDYSLAHGGAIYNIGTISNITGDFSGNYASSENGEAKGGAIFNEGTIHNITGDFIGNYIYGSYSSSLGGAIYNEERGTITIAGDSTFTDNYVEVKGKKTPNAIHNLGTVNFKGTNIVVNDAITGENGTINIASSSNGMTTFNNSVSGNTVNLKQGTLKLGHYIGDSHGSFEDSVNFEAAGGSLTTQDGETNKHNLGNLNLSADLNTSIDVDLNNAKGDELTGSTAATAAEGKKILIDNIKVLADGTNHIIKVKVADANIKDVMDLANDVNIVMNPSDTNSYLVVYENDSNSGNLKFGNVKALETAVQLETESNKVFAMGSDISTDTDLGALTGASLSISGNGHTIDGAGFGGMTIADNQTVSLNDVTVKGFDGAFAENNGTMNIAAGEGKELNLNSGISGSGDINAQGKGKLNINSNIAANKMTVSVSELNLKSNIAANKMTVLGGELNLKNGSELANVENFVANGGVLNVGDQTVNLKKAEFNDGSTLAINVKSDGNGLLKADSLTVNGGQLKATLGQGLVEDGSKTVTLLESGTEFVNKFADVMENNMYRFEKADKAGDYIISLTKTAEDVSQENGGTQNNTNAAKGWVDGNKFEQGSVSADVADKLADLAQNDAKGFNEALSALAPSDTPEVRTNSVNHNTEMFRAVVSHLDDVSKKNQYGLSSGDAVDGVSVWAKAFGNHAKVDNTSKAYGFKSDGYGATLGIEKQLDNAFKVGLGYSYFYNDVDGFMRDSDVNTHTGFVYGEYRPNNWYTNAIASYGYSKYDENKHVAGDVYKAKYDVDNIGAQVMTGYNASVARVDVTPEAGLRYNNIHRDNYVDSAGQAVKAETMDVMTAVAGLKVGKDLVSCFGLHEVYWRPEARLAATYDLISDKENAVVSLSNGSGYVVKGQRLNRFGVEAGAGVTFYLSPDVESSVGYEGKFRSHYQDHTGYVSAKYKF